MLQMQQRINYNEKFLWKTDTIHSAFKLYQISFLESMFWHVICITNIPLYFFSFLILFFIVLFIRAQVAEFLLAFPLQNLFLRYLW